MADGASIEAAELDDDWHVVCSTAELGDEEVAQYLIGGLAIAVYCVDGEYYATADTCSHQGASLAEGYVEDDVIECPLHQACYHIPTGEVRRGPACEDLPTYPAQSVDGWVYVQYAEEVE